MKYFQNIRKKPTVNFDAFFFGLFDIFDLDSTLDMVEDRCAQKKVGQEQHQQDHPLLLGHVPPEGGSNIIHNEKIFLYFLNRLFLEADKTFVTKSSSLVIRNSLVSPANVSLTLLDTWIYQEFSYEDFYLWRWSFNENSLSSR